MRKWAFLVMLLGLYRTSMAQEVVGYQTPPQVIVDLVDAPATPTVVVSPDRQLLLLLERSELPGIAEVAQPELRLAGLRINPALFSPSRSDYYTGLSMRAIFGDNNQPQPVSGLPAPLRMSNLSWSPDGSKLAFAQHTAAGTELWVVDLTTRTAQKLTEAVINSVMPGSAFVWMPDSKGIVYKSKTAGQAAPAAPVVPSGPVVQSNSGNAAPVRTFQDLLKNPYDEQLFDYYAGAALQSVDLRSRKSRALGISGIISSLSVSPVNGYLLVGQLQRPYSYLVPYNRFPQTYTVYDRNGRLVKKVADLPLAENLPKGFDAVPQGPRSFGWAPSGPDMLYWVEAQDGGDPRQAAELRDQLFFLSAPFSGQPVKGPALSMRYSGVSWADNNAYVIVRERWWNNRRELVRRWPVAAAGNVTTLFERSYEDSYTDPGQFSTQPNQYGRQVLLTNASGNLHYLSGQGASPEGNRPFIDEYDITTGKSNRLWRCEAPYYEMLVEWLNRDEGLVLTRRESANEAPNYYIRNLKERKDNALTAFPHPYPALKDVSKQLVRYKRADGVELTGTLYLPAGYDVQKDGPLPMFMWAYPREFKTADAASQVTSSAYEFTRLSWGSPLYWVARGYAIFDNFAMPIIGEGDAQPNETFVEQLDMNARAAIDQLVEMGVADRNRIGVGGHSYGAFMTANLMAHTDLFAGGIARSGAYNRTLTPFGFQSEERTYWEAPDVYNKMSPFAYADRIKEPMLLIHGEADNNSGTFPIQSERFYAALKGHGATVRLVMLPHESHGYRARESVLHTLWEMDQFLEKYVKNRP